MKINLNDIVKVKLTAFGREIYRCQNDEVNELLKKQGGTPLLERREPNVDEEGYTRFQLWDLMQLYGPYIGLAKKLPFETNIEVVET